MATWKKVIVSGSSAALTSLSLDTVVNAGTDTDKFLVLDSSGNVDFRTGTQVRSDIGAGAGSGDITSVVAGTGLSGGATSGDATLNVSGLSVSEFANSALQTSGEEFSDDDTSLMTSAAIQDKIQSFGYTTNVGDITGVTAGNGLSGGGSSGAVSLAVSVDDTTVEINSDTVRAKTAAISDGGTGLATADQIHTFVTSFGYTTNVGDITGVTAGTGLSGGGSSGGVTLNVSGLSVSEFANSALQLSSEEFSNDDTSIMTSAAIEDKILSYGYTTNTGDITGVTAGTGLSGGGSSGGVTLNVSGLTTSEIAAGSLLVAGEDFDDSDTQLMSAAAINDRITSFGYTTNVGDITGVTAGTGLSGGGSSGGVTLAFDGTELSTHTIGDGSGTITISGNLTVTGTTTTVNTTNLDVTDTFITLNNGGSAADAGIVVEGQGAAFAWDESANRWGYDFSGANGSTNSVTFDAYAVTVESSAETVSAVSGNYTKVGNMYVDTSNGEIFIYS